LTVRICTARKRRRSVSPYDRERERYDPRPRYGDDYGVFTALKSCLISDLLYRCTFPSL
jgi:hypothetical protein